MTDSRLVWFGKHAAVVRAVAFDKDGTLLATGPFWQQLCRLRYKLVAEAAGPEAADRWRELVGISPDWVIDRTGPFGVGSMDEEVLVTAMAFYLATRAPWDQCRRQAAEIIHRTNTTLDPASAVQPLPGARDAVLRLKEAGLAVGVITSDYVERAVASLELIGLPASVWDFVLGAESIPRHKPAPDAVFEAASRIGATPQAFAIVGDSPVDMQMARSSGALAVGVREEGQTARGLEDIAEVVLDGVYEIRLEAGFRTGPLRA